jgi:hypothetical protein
MHTNISNESVDLSEDLSSKLRQIMDSKHVSDEEHVTWSCAIGSSIFQVPNLYRLWQGSLAPGRTLRAVWPVLHR